MKLRHRDKKEGNRFIRRAKQFAVAAGFGLGVLIASPEHIMAQPGPEQQPAEAPAQPRAQEPAQPSAEESAEAPAEPRAEAPAEAQPDTRAAAPAETQESHLYSADELVSYLSIITGPATRATHPARAPTAQAATNNSVKIHQILQVVQGDRPAESDPMRRVYDQAISQLGEGQGRAGALQYLQRSLLGSLQRLQELTPQDASELGERAPELRALLQRVSRGASADEEGFDVFTPHLNLLTSLLGVTEDVAAEAQTGPRQIDETARALPLPLVRIPHFNLGAIRLLSARGADSVLSLNGQAGPTTVALFGSEANAQTFVNAYGNAIATLANHPNDAAALRQAAQALYNALNSIPSEREIWSRPGFLAAMQNLQAGNLQQGIRDLGSETSLNTLLQTLNNFYVVSVNQRAVSFLSANATARYEFPENMQAFQDYMRGDRYGGFDPLVTSLDLSLGLDYLLLSGQLQQLQVVDPAAGDLRVVGRQRLRGDGWQFSVRPEITIGTGIGGDDWAWPIELALGSTIIPYQEWSLAANVQMQDGTVRRLEVGDQGPALGLTNLEIRFPGREGERQMFRIPRFGVGIVPTFMNEGGETGFLMNPILYGTLEGNWPEGNDYRLQTLITPIYSYFLNQHRFGADLRPLNFAYYFGEADKYRLFLSPGFRYDYNFGNSISTLEGRLEVGFGVGEGFRADIFGGVLGEVGGSEYERMWTTPFFGVNAQFNIGALMSPSRPTTPQRQRSETATPQPETSHEATSEAATSQPTAQPAPEETGAASEAAPTQPAAQPAPEETGAAPEAAPTQPAAQPATEGAGEE